MMPKRERIVGKECVLVCAYNFEIKKNGNVI